MRSSEDDGLKRGIHFVCGVLLGAPICGFLGYGITGLLVRRWGDFQRASDVELAMTVGAVSAVVGGLFVGLLAMKGLDRFWTRVSDWMDQ